MAKEGYLKSRVALVPLCIFQQFIPFRKLSFLKKHSLAIRTSPLIRKMQLDKVLYSGLANVPGVAGGAQAGIQFPFSPLV
jgi:hypothetical protein